MKIKVCGAAGGEVTGSAYLVETDSATVMVDAGMFQGGKGTEEKNKLPEGVDPKRLNALLLTHAHLDHVGRLPLLLKSGYQGPIFATEATLELAHIVLKDSAKIQVQDAERKNRCFPDEPAHTPLYTPEDLTHFWDQAKAVELHVYIKVAEGVTARFFEAGHMLGSASIELTLEERGKKYIIVFSGDVGPYEQPIVRSFEMLPYADVVFLESTYGDRDHRPYEQTIHEFESIIEDASLKKGKILIPAFAIGRTQQILYHLAILFFEKKVAPFAVYVDSPMAIEAGKIFARHFDLFDEEATDWRNKGALPLDRNYFKFSESVEDSKYLNEIEGPCVIIAGSGMCTGGRILHHFKYNLPHESTHVLIVGYQGEGTLGRRLVDGVKNVKIYGESVEVSASVHTLGGFSAHAGQSDLLLWLSRLASVKPRIFLTHGENPQREALAGQIRSKYGLNPVLPDLEEVIEL